jgi:hypothetical protein
MGLVLQTDYVLLQVPIAMQEFRSMVGTTGEIIVGFYRPSAYNKKA